MRIAQVCPRFYPHIGGVETFVYEISKRLARDFNLEILTTDPSKKLEKIEIMDGILIRRFKSYAPSDSYYISIDLLRFLKNNSNKYDIIHIHNYHALPALFATLSKSKNKLVFTPYYHRAGHSSFRNFLHSIYKYFGKVIFTKSDAIICVSNFEKKLILKDFKVDKNKIYLIPGGVDFEKLKNINKNKLSYLNKNKKIILYVGRIEKYKGVEYVVRALSKLDDRFILCIVGSGPYKQNIIKLANKLGVADRIRFYNNLRGQKLIDKYVKANVLVLLSKYESYGLVVAEALAVGTPCIVANEAALKDWVNNRTVFGINYPINVDNLAKLIERVSEITNVRDNRIMDWKIVASRVKQVYINVTEG
ncbi:glycosyltransferase family 4 protein [Archaeoglobus sp.]